MFLAKSIFSDSFFNTAFKILFNSIFSIIVFLVQPTNKTSEIIRRSIFFIIKDFKINLHIKFENTELKKNLPQEKQI